MAFNLHGFVMKTLEGMKINTDEYQVRQYALKWYSKGVLKDEDLETIDEWYEFEDVPTELDPIEDTDIVEGEGKWNLWKNTLTGL